LDGRIVNTPEWSQEIATRGAIGGPFFMWRRTLLKRIGWFDEQFRSGGDFDYTIRLSLRENGIKTQGVLGSFLNERSGLSTAGSLQPIERTVIQLRYGIYETLDWYYVHSALKYRVQHLLQPGKEWIAIEDLISDYKSLIMRRRSTAWKIPFQSIKAEIRRKIVEYLAQK